MTGQDIRAARERLGESQVQFAKRFGVDQATIHRWEARGAPKHGTARHVIASILDELKNGTPREAAQ
jgi:DNA-binding transcriptional regulator YiaG